MAKKTWFILVFIIASIIASATVFACLQVSDANRDISASSKLCTNTYTVDDGLNIISDKGLLNNKISKIYIVGVLIWYYD